MTHYFKRGMCSIAVAAALSITTITPLPATAGGLFALGAGLSGAAIAGANEENQNGCGPYGCYGLKVVKLTVKIKDPNGRNKTLRTTLAPSDIEAILKEKESKRPAKTAQLLTKRMQAKDDRIPADMEKILTRQYQAIPDDVPNDKVKLAGGPLQERGGTTVELTFEFISEIAKGDIATLGTRKQREGDGGAASSEGDTAY